MLTPVDFIILLSGILNLFLGAIIWFQDPRERINIGFGLFAIATTVLISADFVFRIFPSLITLKLAYSLAVLVPATATLWVLPLAGLKFSQLSRGVRALVLGLPPVVMLIPFAGDLMFEKIIRIHEFGYQAALGPLFSVHASYFVVFLGFFVFVLLSAFRAGNSHRRAQISLVLTGILLYGVTASTVSLILPLVFNVFDYTLLEAPALIFFVGFTFYAIRKFQLFNTKVIATEFFIVLLSVFIFARILFAETVREQYFNGFLLFSTVSIGVLLIRSVVREVSQREEIQRLYKELEIKNVKLTELDKLKSQFLSIATHELRTPLTIVRNFISLMMDGTYGKVSPAAEEAGRQVFERVSDMARSVDTYLNVSRIEQGKISYSFADADLTRLTTLAVEGLKANATKRGLTLSLTVKPGAESLKGKYDSPKIAEVLINLIDNSIKYTEKGSVSVLVEKAGNRGVVTIQDTGVGMTEKTKANLFKLFSPGEDSKRINPASTGVGLYVSLAHVVAHKGTLTAASDGPGKGSKFTVELPLV